LCMKIQAKIENQQQNVSNLQKTRPCVFLVLLEV
jgi:hypothetical protein